MSDIPASVGVVVAAVTLLANFAAIVWGASKINSSVVALNHAVTKLSDAVTKLDERVDAHEVRIAVVEALTAKVKDELT